VVDGHVRLAADVTPTLPPGPHQAARIEHEYERSGAVQYLAAWDVHRVVVFGRCEPRTGKAPFGRLVEQLMSQEPYRSARRVFWIVDNGSSHRGERAAEELRNRHPRVVVVRTPVHANWLNQIELYFSIIRRKVLTPNRHASLKELEERITASVSATPRSASRSPGHSPARTWSAACTILSKPRANRVPEPCCVTGPGISGTDHTDRALEPVGQRRLRGGQEAGAEQDAFGADHEGGGQPAPSAAPRWPAWTRGDTRTTCGTRTCDNMPVEARTSAVR
jgi:DDE superfamily endonuclease